MKITLDHLTLCHNFTLMLLLCKTSRRTGTMTRLFLLFITLFLTISFTGINNSYADHERIPETDTGAITLFSFFDLRERETFVQVTNTANSEFIEDDDDDVNLSNPITLHVQIFDVDNNCNENNFFDVYTPNDTHIYNIRDIQTNDGNPSGVLLPDGAYGFVAVSIIDINSTIDAVDHVLIGNFRIIDNTGYEYRTNSGGWDNFDELQPVGGEWTINFNTNEGVSFSDVVVIMVNDLNNFSSDPEFEVDVLKAWSLFDVDIFDNNENIFSCRNVIFGCVDDDNPLLEALLEEVSDDTDSSASVARFEYGINEAIPHSRGGELLCPGNIISEGFVRFDRISSQVEDEGSMTAQFVGLNNGNGRGSMDFWWSEEGEE